jgi:hypothetical protein
MLARAEVHDLVARGLEKAVRSVLEGPAVVPEPARPAVVPEPAGLPEVPEPASPASRPRPFSIPSPQQPLEPPDLGRIYPTIDGPGGL